MADSHLDREAMCQAHEHQFIAAEDPACHLDDFCMFPVSDGLPSLSYNSRYDMSALCLVYTPRVHSIVKC